MHNPAFPLLARALVYQQNALVLFDPSSQRKRSAVSVDRDHSRELVEGFTEHVLPKNMHRDGQYETLASSQLPGWTNLRIHAIPNLD